ncbi:hypothetical protein J2X63_003191 [Agromyces sp. 3263]|uniref:hypothetical protein n=1 Tax=Agromyces sp. 3263 TaxID=2817750 RepID=UPI00285C28AC|nr:hypothetical protein [Agromyces sp. 3263]MDR6907483.1 hypothetical protein [Agromyces sp. 3263]
MSTETLRAVEDAIQAHIADENQGNIAAGWVAFVYSESMHTTTSSYYDSLVPESQPWHSTVGLVRMLAAEYQDLPLYGGVEDDD